MILEGKVTGITKFGAFVELPGEKTGMVHISEVAPTFVKEIRDFLKEEQMVKVKILRIGEDGKISLSIKQAVPAPAPQQRKPQGGFRNNNNDGERRRPAPDWQKPKSAEPTSFEDMMAKFKQTSDEKMSDLKRVTEAKRGGYSRRGNGKDGNMQK